MSYRITLSYDIYSNFKNYGFKLNTDHDFETDRLIIQAEFLLKLIIDKKTIQKYDLIVIDEVESILRQFSSPTFKGAAPTSFHLLVNLLKHPSTNLYP